VCEQLAHDCYVTARRPRVKPRSPDLMSFVVPLPYQGRIGRGGGRGHNSYHGW